MSCSTKPKHSAFTLIELLVVVAIIVLLISVLIPSLSAARKNAYAVACLSNLRQLGTAAAMYGSEWHDTLPGINYPGYDWLGSKNPPLPGDNTNNQPPGSFRGWPSVPKNGTLFKYMGQQVNAYFCPSHQKDLDQGYSSGYRKYSFTSPTLLSCAKINKIREVLIEKDGSGGNGSQRLADAKPFMIPFFIEEDSGRFLEGTRDCGWANIDGITPRHPGKKGHLGFIDGHAEGWAFRQDQGNRMGFSAYNVWVVMAKRATNGKRLLYNVGPNYYCTNHGDPAEGFPGDLTNGCPGLKTYPDI